MSKQEKLFVSTTICLLCAFLLAHPVTRAGVLAIFPFLTKSWRAVIPAALLCALVFGVYYYFMRRKTL